MNAARAQAVLEELRRRRDSAITALRNAAAAIPAQLAALTDPSQLVSFFCTRRAGKTFAVGLKLFMTCIEYPGCSCLYMGLTQGSAVATLNKDILEVINKRFGLGAVWREEDRRWQLPNGSLIYLRGADANSKEMAKVLGQKYRLAVLDEVAKYRGNVEAMVYGDLLPAMGDDVGTIILSGVPSNITAGLFFDVTTGRTAGWSTHRWTWRENVHKRDNIQKTHDKLIAQDPTRVKTSSYRQEWLGEWVVDEGALVYRFSEDLNLTEVLPPAPAGYHFLLGIDLGYNDPSAFVVGAYSDHDTTLYVVSAAKHSGLILDAVARLVKSMWRMPALGLTGAYAFERMIVDGAALQSVEEMRQRHQLPLECATKTDKRSAIESLNSDLQTGRVKLLPAARCILDEGQKLIWDERKLAAVPRRWEEDPRQDNHALDALLYLWRAARNYDATDAPMAPPDPYAADYGDRHLLEQLAQRNALQNSRNPHGTRVDQAPRGGTGRFGR